MPLREVSDINARLDAVQDLLEHPTFEAEFTKIAKGLPDLERIVSRIHAKNCKVKDFLKVLTVSSPLFAGHAVPDRGILRRHSRASAMVCHNSRTPRTRSNLAQSLVFCVLLQTSRRI